MSTHFILNFYTYIASKLKPNKYEILSLDYWGYSPILSSI